MAASQFLSSLTAIVSFRQGIIFSRTESSEFALSIALQIVVLLDSVFFGSLVVISSYKLFLALVSLVFPDFFLFHSVGTRLLFVLSLSSFPPVVSSVHKSLATSNSSFVAILLSKRVISPSNCLGNSQRIWLEGPLLFLNRTD